MADLLRTLSLHDRHQFRSAEGFYVCTLFTAH